MGIRIRRLSLGLLFLFNLSYGLDLDKFPLNSEVDVTEYSKTQYGVELIGEKKKSPLAYTPKANSYDIKFRAKEYKIKVGDIVVYDLASDKSPYINILDYDKLTIKGDISQCKLAISDRGLFLAEDNTPLKLKNGSVMIEELYSKLDLTKLKSIILFKSNPKCSIKSISVSKTPKKEFSYSKDKATWLWNPKTPISMKKLKKYHINKMYIQVRDGFEKRVSKLSRDGITIFGLNGSPKDIYNYEHLKKDILLLAKLKKTIPNIKGYQIDVEPYTLREFSTDREATLKKYINMIESLSSLCHKHNLQFSIVSPFWYHTIYYRYENLAQVVFKYADEVVLMSYRSDLSKVIDISKEMLRMGELSHKKVYLGVELIKIPDEHHTRYKIVSIESCITEKGFEKECKKLEKLREYTVKGSSISFYNQIDKLSSIDDRDIPFSSFKGFVLHHYGVLP
jgi:hypothetical protein